MQLITKDKNNHNMTNNYIQAVARKTLLREYQQHLPINALEIIRNQTNKYYINTYRYLADICQDTSYITDLKKYEGAIAFSKKTKKYFCYYDGDLPHAKINWLCASFIACVELDMLSDESAIYFPCTSTDIETFAFALLSPSFLLEASNISTPDSIIEYCNLPFDKANQMCRKPQKKYIHSKRPHSAFEQQLLDRFQWFINLVNPKAHTIK